METTPVGCQFRFQRSVYKTFELAVQTIDPVYQPNNALVWRETRRVLDEWFSEIDHAAKPEQTVTVDLKRDFTIVNPFFVPLTIQLLLSIKRSPSS